MYPPYQPPITTPANCAVSKTPMARERVPGPWAMAVKAIAGGRKQHAVVPIKLAPARRESAEAHHPKPGPPRAPHWWRQFQICGQFGHVRSAGFSLLREQTLTAA